MNVHINKIKYFHYNDKHYAIIYQNDKIEIIEDENLIKNKIKELYFCIVKNTFSTFNLLKEKLKKNNYLEEQEKDIIKKMTIELDVDKNISTIKIERLSGKIEEIKEDITNNYSKYLEELINTYNLDNNQLEKYKIKIVNKSKIRNLKVRKSLISLITLASITLTGIGIKGKIKENYYESKYKYKQEELLEPIISKFETKKTSIKPEVTLKSEVTLTPQITSTPEVTLKPSDELKKDKIVSSNPTNINSSNEKNDDEVKDKVTFLKKYFEYLINNDEIYENLKEKIIKLFENSNNLTDEILSLSDSVLVPYEYKNNQYYVIDYEKSYNKFPVQKPNKCWQYAHKYAKTIFEYSNSDPIVDPSVGLTSSSLEEILDIALNELIEGRPTVIEVNGKPKTNRRHFVTVVGIKANCDLNNLKQSDFLIVDPAKGNIIELDTELGGKLIKRYLVNAQDVSYRPLGGEDNEYCIEIYNNPDEYISDTCSKTKV